MTAERLIYTCDGCGETFESDRPDAEALAEFAERFPQFDPEDRAIICEACWRTITEGPP